MTMAAIRIDRNMDERAFSLGPAEILEVRANEVSVRLEAGRVAPARLALAFVYEPAPGDVALVAGDGQRHYVIGILSGSGKTRLDLPGDVELRAEGTLRMSAGAAVEIRAPEVKVAASKLDVLAGAVVERFRSLRQRVSEIVSLHAGESRTVVEGSSHTQSRSATILTQEKVTINGREVHLG